MEPRQLLIPPPNLLQQPARVPSGAASQGSKGKQIPKSDNHLLDFNFPFTEELLERK
jgi:hypothetical protein